MIVEILKGLPASGKSTYAKDKVRNDSTWIRINKDDLRAMTSDSYWSKNLENGIIHARDSLLQMYLKAGFNVIIDDTNFHPKHVNAIKKIAEYTEFELNQKIDIIVNDSFLSVDVDECIKRDAKRDSGVGEKVILDMYYSFVHKENFYVPSEPDLPPCVIIDIDGTIADRGNRSPFDWSKVRNDKPVESMQRLLDVFGWENSITGVFFSGREDVCREDTIQWIIAHGFAKFGGGFELRMRKEKDNRKDSIVKKELFYEHVHGKYSPICVFDDRRQVVNMWRREIGLTCLEVADHRF